ncbi:hypothetical protein [Amaricoccus solimangrovi]|uniref:Uncharacterized protein n=1 Tax=Amaricoccus solimangrovi TaxID=2589815 RepID=A0A501WKW8_9RHOB|nr:hypothetical protein [Amaricoccus solimangrovi]TPE47691.1 hypothetical protein FJM51_19420 [Amaricoccus solimangrovi]
MTRYLTGAAILALLGAPAFAAGLEVTCGDYSMMDETTKMETIAELETETSQLPKEQQLTAEAIHTKLEAECKDKVDMMVIDVVTGK